MQQLPRFSWPAIMRRVRELNKALAEVLQSSQLTKYTVGLLDLRLSDENRHHLIRRMLLVLGVVSYYRHEGERLTKTIPSVLSVFSLSNDFIDKMQLPQRYRTQAFERLAKGEALS